jgi:hypothetical protein
MLLAVIVPLNVPAVVGVPEIKPDVEFKLTPVGNEPVATEYVGAGVPVAVTGKL